ncbi:MAG: hypothetical protein IKE55_10790 [Kiritimatiellae bacterium]|nr:hypothetical protein [Kiritimatiellia bacterium]
MMNPTPAAKLNRLTAGAIAVALTIGAQWTAPAVLSVDLSHAYENKKKLERSFRSAVKGTDKYDVLHHTIVQMPHAVIDNVYALPHGQLFPVQLCFHKEAKDDVFLPDEVTIKVQTVPAIRLMSGNPGTTLVKTVSVGEDLVEYQFRYLKSWGYVHKSGSYSYFYRGPALLAKTDLKPSEATYPFVFWMDYGNLTSMRQSMAFMVIPRINGRQPRTFHSGVVRSGWQVPVENAREYAEFFRDCGMNAVSIIYRVNNGYPANSVTESLPRELKRVGIARFSEVQEVVDAIGLGTRPIPVEDSLCLSDGTPFKHGGARYTCPYAVYSKGEFYKTNLVPFLRRHIVTEDKADHIMPNWEPFKFGREYCFCRNCKREFARFARVDETKIQNLSGEELRKQYGGLWVRFSAAAHAKLVLAIQDAMDEACAGTDKRPLFLPEVNVSNLMPLLDKGRQEMFSHYDARNYVRNLPGICPWAPYNYYHPDDPHYYHPEDPKFRHKAGFHLNIIRCAEFFRQYYEGTKIYFLPQGYQCDYWLSMPEAIAFETFGLFLAGMQGAFPYNFDGYDARYYAALSKCNTMIADSESFMAGAKSESNVTCEPISPVPPLYVYRSHTRFMQQLCENAPVLYPRAFRKGNEIVAFLGNSWSGGEIYGRLKMSGLPDGQYVVEFPGTKRRVFCTASGLVSEGVCVRVEPLDWQKVFVRPARSGEAADADVYTSRLLGRLKQDRTRLQEACDATERSNPAKSDEPLDEALP